MGWRTWFFPLAIVACAMFALEAKADDYDDLTFGLTLEALADDWDNCKSADPDLNFSGCTAIIDAGTDSTKNIAMAHYNLGLAYSAKGKSDRAIKEYDKSIELYPKYADAYNNRGNLYGDMGKYDRAIADFNKAIVLAPKDAKAYYNRAVAFGKKGNLDRAIADLSKVIALTPDDAEAYGNRGLAYETQGKKQKAAADYRKALALHPGVEVATEGLQRLGGSSVKAETSTAKGSFKHFSNTDFAGALLEKNPADSAADCEVQCQSNSNCAAFTFNVWNAACFLKSGVTAALLEPSSVSGLPASAKPPSKSTAAKAMVRYRGKAFPGEPASAGASASFVTCEARCADDPHCVAFSYVKEGSICREFARAGEYSKDSGIDSGVKRQVEQ